MIVWGGRSASALELNGGRYCAASACQVVTWYRDVDGDGYGRSSESILSCAQPAGYVAAGGDCDEASPDIHPDATELCDRVDNDCDGTTDNAAPPGGSSSMSVARSGGSTEVRWTGLAGATGYDLVRGSLAILSSSHGDFTAATDACLANDLAETHRPDPDTPGAGTGDWYLVRGTNCGGAGSYDSGAASQVGSRDAEIQASAAHCP